jgi:hypothetical protein
MEHFIWLQTSIPVVTCFLRMRGKTFPIKNLFAIVTYLLVNLMSSLRTLRSPPWPGWPLWNICVTNNHGYVPFVVNTFLCFPPSWLITEFVTRLTRRVSVVEEELFDLPVCTPCFSGGRVTRSLVLCIFCRSLFVLLSLFFWPLCCLFVFDLRILITSLVSSNSSFNSEYPINIMFLYRQYFQLLLKHQHFLIRVSWIFISNKILCFLSGRKKLILM